MKCTFDTELAIPTIRPLAAILADAALNGEKHITDRLTDQFLNKQSDERYTIDERNESPYTLLFLVTMRTTKHFKVCVIPGFDETFNIEVFAYKGKASAQDMQYIQHVLRNALSTPVIEFFDTKDQVQYCEVKRND